MATTNTTLYNSGQKAARRAGGQPVTIYAEVALAAAGLNDTVNMFKIPSGARVVDWSIGSDDIDSNGTPTVTLSLGDSGSATRYVSASTIGQTGAAPIDAKVKTGYGFLYSADDTCIITVSAAAATFAAGSVRCHLTYTFDN